MKKWMRPSSIRFLERNPDALYAKGFVTLSNSSIVKIMAAGFEVVMRDTFFISCRARQILADNLNRKIYSEDEIFKAERAINAHLEKLHEYFDTRIHQGEQKLQLAGFSTDEMQRIPSNYETKTVTNAVTQYSDLIAKADLYTSILHYLWLTSELADNPDEAMRAKLNTERDIRDHLFSITRFTQSHYTVIRRICTAVVESRRLAREQQSERDRQRHLETQASETPEKKKAKKKRKNDKAVLVAQSELSSLSLAAEPA